MDFPEGVSDPHAYVSRDAHQTSLAAAKAVWPRSGTQREKVMIELYRSLAQRGGMTDDELVQCTGTGVKAGVRRQELVAMGYAEDSGTVRKTRSGCDAIVWRLTPEIQAKIKRVVDSI